MKSEKEVRKLFYRDFEGDAKDMFSWFRGWVLDGPPRYSVEEMKIMERWYYKNFNGAKDYLNWMEKYPDKVREILDKEEKP